MTVVVVVMVPPAMLMWRSGLQGRKWAEQHHGGDYEADQNSHNLSSPFRASFYATWLGYELVAEY